MQNLKDAAFMLEGFAELSERQYYTARLAGVPRDSLQGKSYYWYQEHRKHFTSGKTGIDARHAPALPLQKAFLASVGYALDSCHDSYPKYRRAIANYILNEEQPQDERFRTIYHKYLLQRTKKTESVTSAVEANTQVVISDDIDAVLAYYNEQFHERYGSTPAETIKQPTRALIKRRLGEQSVDELKRTVSAYVWMFDHANYPVEISRLFSDHPKLQFVYDNCRAMGQTENLALHKKAAISGQSVAQIKKAVGRGDLWIRTDERHSTEHFYETMGETNTSIAEFTSRFPNFKLYEASTSEMQEALEWMRAKN